MTAQQTPDERIAAIRPRQWNEDVLQKALSHHNGREIQKPTGKLVAGQIGLSITGNKPDAYRYFEFVDAATAQEFKLRYVICARQSVITHVPTDLGEFGSYVHKHHRKLIIE